MIMITPIMIMFWGQFHKAAKQEVLLSKIKQTASRSAYVLHDNFGW